MQQHIRYAVTADDVKLAWSAVGHGPPLVKAATWLTHLQYDLESPIWKHWVDFFSGHFRYIRYDERGCGLSDRKVPKIAATHWVDDLETVVEAAGLAQPFALLGISQGAATAVRYAVKHPERVSHLILYGGYAVGGNLSDDPERRKMFSAVMDVIGLGWGNDNPAFRQLFTSRFVPDGTQEQLDWFNELCRRTASPDVAAELLEARGKVDVRELLPRVRMPTLVLHASRDKIAPLEQGRLLAAHIPGARFVQLESRNHVLLRDEPAWKEFCAAVLEFTGQASTIREAGENGLTVRERNLLALLREGRSNAQIAFQLGIAEKTVRNHFSNLYRKLGVRSRVEALLHTRPGA
ncbi:MAG: alpha/beta fold hydrolase [Proteobacteria bacterium]|nr:alpha/beta fold hydrolase [Pseudomonadota bacterium]